MVGEGWGRQLGEGGGRGRGERNVKGEAGRWVGEGNAVRRCGEIGGMAAYGGAKR